MQLNVQNLEAFGKAAKRLGDLGQHRLPEFVATALNDTAFMLRKATQNEMQSVFDRPKVFTTRSVLVGKATAAKLEATVMPTYMGGKGIDPQQYLRAQAMGGGRKNKRSENALMRAGLLPRGMQTSIPSRPFPGSDDGHGNIKGSFIVKLISYFQAFGEQGYKANMKASTMKRQAKLTKTERGFKSIGGVVFFVSHGYNTETAGHNGSRRASRHLAAGIWAKSGIHGVKVQPVLMFTREGQYKERLDFEGIANKSGTQAHFEKRLRRAIYQEWERGFATR